MQHITLFLFAFEMYQCCHVHNKSRVSTCSIIFLSVHPILLTHFSSDDMQSLPAYCPTNNAARYIPTHAPSRIYKKFLEALCTLKVLNYNIYVLILLNSARLLVRRAAPVYTLTSSAWGFLNTQVLNTWYYPTSNVLHFNMWKMTSRNSLVCIV